MDALTEKNLKWLVTEYKEKFPKEFRPEDLSNMSITLQEDFLKKINSILGIKPRFKSSLLSQKLNKNTLKKIDPDFEINKTLYKRLERVVEKRKEKAFKEMKNQTPKPLWGEIDKSMRRKFKRWIDANATKYDDEFNSSVFEQMSDDIKVDFYFMLAKKFGIKNYYDLKEWTEAEESVLKIKKFKISDKIYDAIFDATTEYITDKAAGNNTKKAKMDSELNRASLDKKRERYIVKAKSIKTFEQYHKLLNSPEFDREMLDIILKRMKNKRAFSLFSDDHKKVLKLIAQHPLTTADDLVFIKEIKANRSFDPNDRKQTLYNSKDIDVSLAKNKDAPIDELMKIVRKPHLESKVLIADRDDLSVKQENILLGYTVRHHVHKPDEVLEIFETRNRDIGEYKDQIKASLLKKYFNTNPLKYLEVLVDYGFKDDLSEDEIDKIVDRVTGMIRDNKKERIYKKLENIFEKYPDFINKIYTATGDEYFLPDEIKDIFLF